MANIDFGDRIGKTKYKHVSEWKNSRGTYFKAHIRLNGKTYTCSNGDLKLCATQLDIKLIESGRQPVNVLKPK